MVKPKKKQQEEKSLPVFAEGLSFKKLFFVFVVGSIFGDYYERIINLVGYSWGGTPWFWERRSGVIYGPFSVIYGFGAVLMVLAFIWLPNKLIKQAKKRKSIKSRLESVATDENSTPLSWWQLVLAGGLLGGIAEYIFGVLQEIFTGTVSWNYSDHFLNINGKTSPYVMLIWGLICLIFVKYAYPPLSRLIEKIPQKIGNVIFWILLAFLTFDMLISFSAVLRMNLRRHNVPTFTPYGEFLDSTYPDKRIRAAYPNMVEV